LTSLKRIECTSWPGEDELTDLDHPESKKATPMQISGSILGGTEQESWDIPTMMNSAGIRMRRKKKMTLRTGHPSVFKSLKLLGLNTRESHAATVRVQTKKYLCADRWGGRRRELGNKSGLMVMLVADMMLVGYQGDERRWLKEPNKGRKEREES